MAKPDREIKQAGGGSRVWARSAAVLFWLCVWQLAAQAVGMDIILPSPVAVVSRFVKMCQTLSFYKAVAYSSARIFAGLFMGVVLGGAFGALAARFGFVRELIAPLVAAARAVPVVSFIIIALFLIPSAETRLSAVISFIICFPVFYTNTLAGVKSADSRLTEMARAFHMRNIKRFRHIYVPAVIPYLKAAFNVSVGLAWKSGVAAEYIAIPKGSVGEMLNYSKTNIKTADTLAWTLALVLASLLFEFCLQAILKLAGRAIGGR